MYIDLFHNPIHKKVVHSLEEAFWVFARHVTCETMQVADFEEYYEENRGIRLTKKKLSFRGIGLDKDDNPILRLIDSEGEAKFVPTRELTDKEASRLYRELEKLADLINCRRLLLSTTVYNEWPHEEYAIIDVIFNLDWSPDYRINFLANAGFTDNDSHAAGIVIPFEGKEWVIDGFLKQKGDHSVLAHPKDGNKKDSRFIDLLLLPAEELDRIIEKIKEGDEGDHQHSLNRSSDKTWE